MIAFGGAIGDVTSSQIARLTAWLAPKAGGLARWTNPNALLLHDGPASRRSFVERPDALRVVGDFRIDNRNDFSHAASPSDDAALLLKGPGRFLLMLAYRASDVSAFAAVLNEELIVPHPTK
ncbi:hypothetical protein LCGC14_2234000, partial [marine sediment metagenome]